jgi:hypothetical protein
MVIARLVRSATKSDAACVFDHACTLMPAMRQLVIMKGEKINRQVDVMPAEQDDS